FSKMTVGRAKYTVMLTKDGTIVDDMIVYRLGENRYLTVPNAGNAKTVADALEQRLAGIDATVEDATNQLALLGIQGPKAQDIVAALGDEFAETATSLKNYRVSELAVSAYSSARNSHLVEKLSGYRAFRRRQLMDRGSHRIYR